MADPADKLLTLDFLRALPKTDLHVHLDGSLRISTLIELAQEYRRVVSYDEVPPVLREAILSAEDRNFFSHSGLEYRALPRVIRKAAEQSWAASWRGDGYRLRFPQGGSTLTQQLVRGYFLRDLTTRENGDAVIGRGLTPRLLSTILGIRATNKLVQPPQCSQLSNLCIYGSKPGPGMAFRPQGSVILPRR